MRENKRKRLGLAVRVARAVFRDLVDAPFTKNLRASGTRAQKNVSLLSAMCSENRKQSGLVRGV